VILAGRRINDDMGKYVAENVIKSLIKAGKSVKGAKVAVLGFTFKENCPDTRNSKVFDIVKELREYGIEPTIADPAADVDEAKRLYGVDFTDISNVKDMDAVVLAVAHKEFSSFTLADMDVMFGEGKKRVLAFNLIYCAFIIIGSVMNVKSIIEITDAMMIAMCVPNVIVLYILAPEIKKDLREYLKKYNMNFIKF
jgi:hypothetical protein